MREIKKIRFDELNISDEILKAVEDMGFEETTPIQTRAIPHIMEGRDIIGQAQTGTGKTAAFGIPILETIDPDQRRRPQVIILCPTRELAVQVAEELKHLSLYKRNLNILPIYGGQPINRQIRALKKGVQIVIGTPGRVMDHMRRGTLKLSSINQVVLDEADVMLDMGFIDDIETILRDVPEDRQTLFFSATIPHKIRELSEEYQKDSIFVKVAHEKMTVPEIEQYYFEVRRNNKLDLLIRLLDLYNIKLSLVFCNTRKMVDELNIQLQSRGYLADALHGGMRQSQRDRVMDKFRNGIIEIMVATDVAARGLDIDNVEAVFNYDVPQDTDYYVHRIGRTARAGKTGMAFTFIVGKDIYKLRDIQRYIKTNIHRHSIPTRDDIEEAKLDNFIDNLTDYIEREHLGKYIKMIENLLEDDFTAIEIAAALMKMVFEGENKEDEDISNEILFADTGAEPGMARLFINIGEKDKIGPRHIVGAIAGETGLPGKLIGAIDVHENFTFVEVPRDNAEDVLKIMRNNYIKGNKVNIEPAKPK